MSDRVLTVEELGLITELLYDEAKSGRTRLHHRTGETGDRPLFSTWIQLANLFRDADRVVLCVRADSVSERGYSK